MGGECLFIQRNLNSVAFTPRYTYQFGGKGSYKGVVSPHGLQYVRGLYGSTGRYLKTLGLTRLKNTVKIRPPLGPTKVLIVYWSSKQNPHSFLLFVIGTTLYICMSALPFWIGIFITFNKENYHIYCFMYTCAFWLTKHWRIPICYRKV